MVRKSVAITLAISSIVAGIAHLVEANPLQFQANAKGLFFVALGVFQLFWWVIILLRPKNKMLVILGLIVNSISIALYFVIIVTPLPIINEHQHIPHEFPLLTKVLEAIFIVDSIGILTGK